jgi:hypothetical protein
MGSGICLDKTNALIALARAGGIPARYCQIDNINALNGQAVPWISDYASYFHKWEESTDWRLKTIGRGMFLRFKQQEESNFQSALWVGGHIMAELKINNSWILADPTLSDEEAAGHSLPLPRLGYDPIALLGFQGSVTNRNESSQVGRSYWITRWLLCLFGRGFFDLINQTLEEKKQMGKLILENIGEKEYMRRMRRFYIPLPQAVELDTSVFS